MEEKIITLRSLEKTSERTCFVMPSSDFSGRWHSKYVREWNDNTKSIMNLSGDEGYYVPSNFVKELKNDLSFNLSDEIQSRQWDAIKNSSCITTDIKKMFGAMGDTDRKTKSDYGDAIFYVHDEDKRQSVIKRNTSKKKEALNFINGDSAENLRLRLRLLGIESAGMSIAEAEAEMFSRAINTPEKIISIYTDQFKKYQLIYFKALDKDIFTELGNAVFYGDRNLGSAKNAQSIIADDKVFREKIIKESL